MRLSGWRAHAPMQDSVSPKVIRIVESALATLGAEADPECWIVWGDDPATPLPDVRPVASGLIQVNVRVTVPGEGPRAAAKVIRWNRVQLGELAVEIQGGHRLVTFQVGDPGPERRRRHGRRDRELRAGALRGGRRARRLVLGPASAATAPAARRKTGATAATAVARRPPTKGS